MRMKFRSHIMGFNEMSKDNFIDESQVQGMCLETLQFIKSQVEETGDHEGERGRGSIQNALQLCHFRVSGELDERRCMEEMSMRD